jgi:hypothetical protein
MPKRSDKGWLAYVMAVAAVIAVAFVTASIPILSDRFTLFLFWPLIIAVAWYGGVGPALVTTALSAVFLLRQASASAETTQLLALLGVLGTAALIAAVISGFLRPRYEK